MPELTIRNLAGKKIPVTDPSRSLLYHLQQAGQDWMHACGGKGRCTTCRIRIVAGAGHLPDLTAAERKYRDAGRLRPDERLTCQCRTQGDLEGEVPEACKLPHLVYSY
jgi:ferredoxin, 2Fe-2S